MLQAKLVGLTTSALKEQPIKGIISLLFEYQHLHESACHGMSRGLALASELHGLLIGTKYYYKLWYNNRHLTISIVKNDVYNGQSISGYTNTMHPLEIIRITETEEGR
jgi:hypothetical protein